VKLVDANVLLYAVNSASAEHERSRRWLDSALSGGSVVGMAWVPLLAFVRISTRPGLFPRPLTVGEATGVVQEWLGQPACTLLHPTARHPFLLADLLEGRGVGGNLVNDAHLAALAIEHRAEIVSYDTDFARFPGVRHAPPPALG
jgi:toxin-antitoxin system PIN domain toxin